MMIAGHEPIGIGRVHYCGPLDDSRPGKNAEYIVMVMDLLGLSLEDVFSLCDRKFSLKTILLIAEQMVCHSLCPSFHSSFFFCLIFCWPVCLSAF